MMKFELVLSEKGEKVLDELIEKEELTPEEEELLNVLGFVEEEYVIAESDDINSLYNAFKEAYEEVLEVSAPPLWALDKALREGYIVVKKY